MANDNNKLKELVPDDKDQTADLELPILRQSDAIDDAEPAASEEPLFLSGEENTLIVESLQRVIERHHGDDFELYLSGSPVFLVEFQKAMQRDMARFAGLAVLMIAVCLGALFRRVAAVLLPWITYQLITYAIDMFGLF